MVQGSAAPSRRASASTIGGRYQVERLLGQGGMGSVFAVTDRSSGARLALKRLAVGAKERAATLFEREYRTLAGLRHPCIVEVYDYGADPEGAFYTMELVEGGDLSTRAPIPWRTACAYLRDAASILGLLHARRLLHRDLSPRNLLVSPSGRLKLIDFGALAEFGPAVDVVGTPPFVSPEALRAGSLDERSDLFALGALGYWLVTGSNAFPARSLQDLPQLWQREPVPASQLVQLIGSDVLEPPPHELDDLLAALLRVDPKERPSNTAELIDRLNAVAELPPERVDDAVQGYLQSKAYVGRERERERFVTALGEARTRGGQALIIEGGAGVGRSRFLEELEVVAQLEGALTIRVDASRGRRPYGLAESVLAHFLRVQPERARPAMQPHAALLGHISPALREQLEVGRLSQVATTPGEERVRIQHALLDVLSSLTRDRFSAILVDDLQAVDEESQALLATLAAKASELALCLTVTLARDARTELTPAAASMRLHAQRLRLLPLTQAETRELLRSVFGEVTYLDRLSERLHRVSEGNPAHCLELAQHLVKTGAARYVEGSWSLPVELPPESLPRTRQAGLLSRLDRLSIAARTLARRMSVPHGGGWTLEHAAAAGELSAEQAHDSIAALEREGVLRGFEAGFQFTHEDLRTALEKEMTPAERTTVHARVGAALRAEQGDAALRLRACAHLLRADELQSAYPMLKSVLFEFTRGDLSQLGSQAVLMEEVVELLREREQDDYALCAPLGVLAVAGYFVDRRYAARYGDAAIETLCRVLKLGLLPRLTPWLGRRLGLIVTLLIAGIGMRIRAWRSMPLQVNVRMLLSAASSLAGVSSVCIDPDRGERYARVLEPFTVLGPNHPASIVHDFSHVMTLTVRDRPARAAAALRSMIARLENQSGVGQLPESVRRNYYAGCHLSLGVIETWRDAMDGLAIADKLEQFSPLYAMAADHLRASYFAGQGDRERAEACQRRVEVHAVQLGSAWQVETWAPAEAMRTALRTGDSPAMKRVVQELGRLSAEIPSLAIQEKHARVSYLVLRGKHRQALELMEDDDEVPHAVVGWLRLRGVIARAHNELGQHEQARALCLRALADTDPADLEYAVMNLNVSVELALAEAGLGRLQLARTQLDKLLQLNEPNNSAVSSGVLYEARARVSLLAREFPRARAELEASQSLYKRLGSAALIERTRVLSRQIDHAENPTGVGIESGGARLDDVNHLLTRVQLMLSQVANTEIGERAQRCLQIALELTSADDGFLVLRDADEPAAHLGGRAPDEDVVSWAEESLLDADLDAQTVMTEDVDSQIDSNYKVVGSHRYCVAPLWARQGGEDGVVAALVLGFDNRVPRMPEPEVLRAIASHLVAR